jgi:hypothetical protein
MILLLVSAAAIAGADTARVIRQYKIHEDTRYAKDVVAQEVSMLEQEYNVIPQIRDEWGNNNWAEYIANVVMDNRTWYAYEVGTIWRTNLISNTGRKYVVFTRISDGGYNERTLEYVQYNYTYWAYEIR